MNNYEEKKLLKTGYQNCQACGHGLVTTHSRRILQDMGKSYFLDIQISRCINEGCACKGVRIYPEEYRSLIYPKSRYSLGVYSEVGYQRLNESKSVSQIRKSLEASNPELGLRDRTIENIYKRVQVCLRQRQEDKDNLKQRLLESGVDELCLTLDGIAPERGNAILYVVREVHSGIILYARYLEHSDTGHLKSDLLEPLKDLLGELPYPVCGWLCDKQSGFIAAIESVFENVPVHLCHAHFLKAMGKPVKLADSEMAGEIKKNSVPSSR